MPNLPIITYSLLVINIKHAFITKKPTYTDVTFITTNKLVKNTVIIFTANNREYER
jgi:hypothetical protein